MDLKTLEDSGLILYKTIVGSRAYGTNNETSDTDIKGFYWVDPSEYLSLNPPVTPQTSQINDEKHNVVFYSLYRAFELLKTANPNFIELLWTPKDCVIKTDDVIMPILLENRNLFITKEAYHSHADYALAQIKKAKGKNKKVHNPCPETMPVKEDFCRVILLSNFQWEECDLGSDIPCEENGWTFKNMFPFRPTPIKETNINLNYCHVASLEHAPNIYRLYHYGDKAKGVFRGDNMLVCESIPKQDEWDKIIGLLIYDKNEYDKAVKDWHSYWDWVNNRNDHRWIDQEKGLLTYDAKNMMHSFRLIYSGINILETGEPIVRFEGDKLQFLKDIRNAMFSYGELMDLLSGLNIEMEKALKKCILPLSSDPKLLNSLYGKIMEIGSQLYLQK